jgi:hypothetical protein
MSPPTPTRPRLATQILTRLFYRADGELSPLKICATALGSVLLFTMVSVPLLAAGGVSTVNGLATWVLILLVGVKLPALAIFWWMLGRHVEKPGQEQLSSEDAHSLMARLQAQAETAHLGADPETELKQLKEDAWFVADRAPDADKAAAVACALRIQELSAVRQRSYPSASANSSGEDE